MTPTGKVSVLLVDDDERLASLVCRGLERAGHAVQHRSDGVSGLDAARDPGLDVIVLDIGIPGPDGLSVLRSLRQRGDQRPVLLLTGRGSVADRVTGLQAGADDYLPKPFALDELVARVEALARRWKPEETETLQSAGVTLDPAARTVFREGRQVELTPREFDLLEFLLRNPNQALSSETIRDRVWDNEDDAESNVVAVYIGYLRAKIDKPFGRRSIQTVRGVGYRWDPSS